MNPRISTTTVKTIIGIFSLLALSSAAYALDIDQLGKPVTSYQANPKAVTETKCTAKEEFGELKAGSLLSRIRTEYGPDMRPVKEIVYDIDKSVKETTEYQYADKEITVLTYDRMNELKKKIVKTKQSETKTVVDVFNCYDDKQELDEKHIITASVDGLVKEEIVYSGNGAFDRKVVRKYDSNQRLIEIRETDQSGKPAGITPLTKYVYAKSGLLDKVTYGYRDQDNTSEDIYKRKDGTQLISHVVVDKIVSTRYQFMNEKGRIDKELYAKDDIPESLIDYEYEENGNISGIYFYENETRDGKDTPIVKRATLYKYEY